MARSTRRSRRSSSLPALPAPDSDEEDAVRPYVRPARLESPFATDRMTAAISLQPQQEQQQQPQQEQQPQQRTREQRASAAEQELVLTAAALRRSAAARARLNGDTDDRSANDDSNGIDDDGSNPSILDGLEMNDVMNNDAAMMEVIDENNNGTFIDGIDYRFRWKNWSKWFAVPPPSY